MARWVWPAAAGLVGSGIGVAINLATDGNPWAWVALVVLTAAGVGVALRLQPAAPAAPAAATTATPEATPTAGPTAAPEAAPAAEPRPEAPPSPPRSVHNTFNGGSGVVHGPVIQVGYVGSPDAIKVDSPTTVNQNAVAREGGTIYQAGRDVRPNP